MNQWGVTTTAMGNFPFHAHGVRAGRLGVVSLTGLAALLVNIKKGIIIVNKAAISRAEKIMQMTFNKGSDETDLVDLIADLHQWCVSKGWDWDKSCRRGNEHATNEMREDYEEGTV
jgi:hypothetical protein